MTGFSPRPVRSAWVSLVAAFVGGAAMGIAAKLADQSGIAGVSDLGTYFGLWIVVATLIAAWSRSRQLAALRVGAFMLAMVAAYYLVTLWLFAIFPVSQFLTWGAAAVLLTPLFAVLTWPSRQQGWLPAFAAALPIGMLLAEAYSFRWVLPNHLFQFMLDIGSAAMLFAVLPRSGAQRVRVLAVTPPAFLVAIGFMDLLPYVAGALRGVGLRL